MTLATISSFFSNTPEPCAALILVRAASFSDAVAPRHNEKSIVDDCANANVPPAVTPTTSGKVSSRVRSHGGTCTIAWRNTHVLSPQLFLHDCVWDVPARDALCQLRRLRRVMGDGLLRRRLLEPEVPYNLLCLPERVHHARDERKRSRARARLSLSDDLLDEAPIFRSLAVVKGRALENAPTRKPYKGRRREETTGNIEVHFVR